MEGVEERELRQNALTNKTARAQLGYRHPREGVKGFDGQCKGTRGNYMSRRVFKLSRSMASRT